MMIGVVLDYNGANLLNDESYFKYSLNQVSQIYVKSDSGSETQRIKKEIPTAPWTLNSFDNLSKVNYELLGISEYLWPTKGDVTIAANYYAPRYDYIEFKLYRCNQNTSKVLWKTDIPDVIKQAQLSLVVSNNYFDFDNYTEPIHRYLDDRFFWDLAPGLRKKVDIFIKKNGVDLIDDFVQLGQSNSFSFYEVSHMRESIVIEDTDLQLASIYFRLDSYFDNYSRRIYSVGDLLGQTGGFYSSVLIIGSVFVGIFSERLFVSSILRKIYQIDKNRDDQVRKLYANSKGNKSIKIIDDEFTQGILYQTYFLIKLYLNSQDSINFNYFNLLNDLLFQYSNLNQSLYKVGEHFCII